MNNKLIIAGFSAFLLCLNCKKEEKASVENNNSVENKLELKPELSSKTNQEASPVYKPEDLAKEVKGKPVTHLVLSESNFDFGKITKGDKVEHSYTVTNTGDNPLIIAHVRPGCGCTAPEFTKDPILPGKKGKITLKFDSSNFDGRVQKQAEVYANVEAVPLLITFTADIQPTKK
jgi:hypothetical protein